jgi:hypothetical protein
MSAIRPLTGGMRTSARDCRTIAIDEYAAGVIPLKDAASAKIVLIGDFELPLRKLVIGIPRSNFVGSYAPQDLMYITGYPFGIPKIMVTVIRGTIVLVRPPDFCAIDQYYSFWELVEIRGPEPSKGPLTVICSAAQRHREVGLVCIYVNIGREREKPLELCGFFQRIVVFVCRHKQRILEISCRK